jgi:hypothetical protein
MKIFILEYLSSKHKALRMCMIIIYAFTFIPMSYVFTNFQSAYWYYYILTALIGLLSSWLLLNVIEELSYELSSVKSAIFQYQLTGLLIILVFIIIPLIGSSAANNMMENFFERLLAEGGKLPNFATSYLGPSLGMSSFIFLFFFNTHVAIQYFKSKV